MLRPDSFFFRLPEPERKLFVQQLLTQEMGHSEIANYWTQKGYPISHVAIHKYRKKPEFAEALSKGMRKLAFRDEVERTAKRTVVPRLQKLVGMAEETFELAKGEGKKNYKAMTDAMGVLLGVVRLEAEVNGELGQAVAKEQASQSLTIEQMIVLPRTITTRDQLKGEDVGEVVDVQGMEVPLLEDFRLLEDEDESEEA